MVNAECRNVDRMMDVQSYELNNLGVGDNESIGPVNRFQYEATNKPTVVH